MRIGELAQVTGVTPRALRHYEQAGLISSERAHNGYRVYAENAVTRVRNIRHLLVAGLTLDDVRAFLPCLDGDVTAAPPSERGIQIALNRLAMIDDRIAAQIQARDRLASALAGLRRTRSDRVEGDEPTDRNLMTPRNERPSNGSPDHHRTPIRQPERLRPGRHARPPRAS